MSRRPATAQGVYHRDTSINSFFAANCFVAQYAKSSRTVCTRRFLCAVRCAPRTSSAHSVLIEVPTGRMSKDVYDVHFG